MSGKKNIAKLIKKEILNTKGKRQTVYVKPNETPKQSSFKKIELDKNEKEMILNLSEITINGDKYEFMQLVNSGRGNVFAIEYNGKEIGRATYVNNGSFLDNIRIDNEHRRKGLATKMYQYIEQTEKTKIKPSPNKQSPEIKQFWKKKKPNK